MQFQFFSLVVALLACVAMGFSYGSLGANRVSCTILHNNCAIYNYCNLQPFPCQPIFVAGLLRRLAELLTIATLLLLATNYPSHYLCNCMSICLTTISHQNNKNAMINRLVIKNNYNQ